MTNDTNSFMACIVKVITGNRNCLTNDFRSPASVIAHMLNCKWDVSAIVSRIGFPLSNVSSCASSSLCSSIKSANLYMRRLRSAVLIRDQGPSSKPYERDYSFMNIFATSFRNDGKCFTSCWVRCFKCFTGSAFNERSIHI